MIMTVAVVRTLSGSYISVMVQPNWPLAPAAAAAAAGRREQEEEVEGSGEISSRLV